MDNIILKFPMTGDWGMKEVTFELREAPLNPQGDHEIVIAYLENERTRLTQDPNDPETILCHNGRCLFKIVKDMPPCSLTLMEGVSIEIQFVSSVGGKERM